MRIARSRAEEKLRTLSRAINGDTSAPIPMRRRLSAKLSALRKGVTDITNSLDRATVA